MDLDTLLLTVAARHRIEDTDPGAALRRFEAVVGHTVDATAFAEAVARAVAAGELHDPVRIPDGALQCRWRLEIAPAGAARLAAMPRARA